MTPLLSPGKMLRAEQQASRHRLANVSIAPQIVCDCGSFRGDLLCFSLKPRQHFSVTLNGIANGQRPIWWGALQTCEDQQPQTQGDVGQEQENMTSIDFK